MKVKLLWLRIVLGTCGAACGAAAALGQGAGDAAWRQEVAHLHAQREAYLRNPEGWLSLVALEWLKPGETTVGSGAGNGVRLAHGPAQLMTLRQVGGRVTVVRADGSVRLEGRAAAPGSVVSADAARPGELRSGGLLLTVIPRGDRLYLRVKDRQSATLEGFHGTDWFAADPALRVVARWVPSAAGHTVRVPNVLGQVSEERSPGVAQFQLAGRTFRLEPLVETSGEMAGTLFFIFRDETSRSSTYGAGRFLFTPMPDHGVGAAGTVVLDFNRALNPPCAFTPYATCPLPPAGNRLPVAIPAGEKRYVP